MPKLGLGFSLAGAVGARRKLLLDKVPDAELLYSPSLRLSQKITKSIELRRTSDEEEEEFSPEQWQASDVTAFAGSGDARATQLFDFSGNGRTATQTTAGAQPFAVTGGVLEEGLRFAGEQFLEVNATSSILKPAEVTYAFWAKAASTGTIRVIFTNRDTTSDGVTIWQRAGGPNMSFDYAGSGDNQRWDTNYALPVDEWTFIVFTRSGLKRELYVNGLLQDTITDAGSLDAGLTTGSIGGIRGSSSFLGKIPFFGIYDRVLSATEIATVRDLTDPR